MASQSRQSPGVGGLRARASPTSRRPAKAKKPADHATPCTVGSRGFMRLLSWIIVTVGEATMTLERDDNGRRAPRTTTHFDGSLLGRSRREVTVVELSPTGCLVVCSSAPDRGAILDLELEIEGRPFAAKVRVSQSSVEGGSLPE